MTRAELGAMPARLAEHAYGKDGIRVATVVRGIDGVHELHDVTVRVRLEGDFSPAYLVGDNSTSLPTDSMRAAAYVVAQDVGLAEPEVFAEALLRRLLGSTPAAGLGRAEVVDHAWDRLALRGAPQPHAFRRGDQVGTASVAVERDGAAHVTSGLGGLVLLKTTGSGYAGFLRDDLTVLAETDDRILATEVTATWGYQAVPQSYTATRASVGAVVEEVFATHDSLAMQHTLHAMGTAVLAAIPEIARISLTLPNIHHVPADLERYGRSNPGEVFVVLDRPFGVIEGTIERA